MAETPSLYPRHAETRVKEALTDTRVVALVGPRQCGKTTLARKVGRNRLFLTLDDEATRELARSDPTGFLRGVDTAVIDEIQRAPSLLLAIKRSVDQGPRPGRFLITGSADLFAGSTSPDSLAGRVETIALLPLSQSELERRRPSSFLERAFGGRIDARLSAGPTSDLVERVLRAAILKPSRASVFLADVTGCSLMSGPLRNATLPTWLRSTRSE